MTATLTTARDVIAMLRRHYLPMPERPGGIFAPEIAAPLSSRRADLIWQGVTAGSGHELIGHEVKVSRADVLAELADPTKSDPWMRYCDRWYLVLPSLDLIKDLELPETWGVLTPPSGRRTRTMTTAVKAPKLKPKEQGPALLTLATWLHWRLDRAQRSAAAVSESERRLLGKVAELEQRIPQVHGVPSPVEKVVKEIVDHLGVGYQGRLGDDWHSEIKTEDVAAEIKELGAVRGRADRIRRQINSDLTQMKMIRNHCDQTLAEAVTATVQEGQDQ